MSAPRNVAESIAAKGTFFKSDMPSRKEEKRAAAIAEDSSWKRLCAYVNHRDELRCRACDRRVNPLAMSMLEKGHHHHVVYASAGGLDAKENVCLLCADCHDAEHVTRKLSIEGDAEKGLAFYKRAADDSWYLWKQETGVRVYVEVD